MYMKTIVSDTQNIAACGLYCGACRKSSWRRNVPDVSKMKRRLGVKSAHAAKKTSSILVQNARMT